MPSRSWIEVPIDQFVEGVPDEGYTPFSFPPEGGSLLFSFTDSSFTRVLSALINGAALTYPDDWIQVVWDFLVNMEFPVPICAQIIECINTDADTQAALADYLATNELARAALQQLIDNGSVVTNPGGTIVQTDDLDALFGSITYLVDTMNGLNEDLYEAMEASTNKRELGSLTFRAIPLLNELPLDEASDYIDDLAADVAENYDAEYTTTPLTGMRDRIRCALFCLARDNDNALTWDLIAHYFWDQVGYSSDYVRAFRDFVTFFNSGSWPGEQIVFISFANIASVLSQASKFAEMTLPSLNSLMKLGANDPDPDWPNVCEECPETWEHDFDLTLDDGGFSIWGGPFMGTPGVWHSGVGWVSGFATAGGFAYQMVQIQRAFDPTTITSAEVTYTMTNGINGGLTRLLDTSAGTLASSTDIPPDGPGTFSGSGTEAGATYIGLRVQAGNQAGSSDPGGTCTVTRLVVRGDGVDPFI